VGAEHRRYRDGAALQVANRPDPIASKQLVTAPMDAGKQDERLVDVNLTQKKWQEPRRQVGLAQGEARWTSSPRSLLMY
jgi:hypothetical protein